MVFQIGVSGIEHFHRVQSPSNLCFHGYEIKRKTSKVQLCSSFKVIFWREINNLGDVKNCPATSPVNISVEQYNALLFSLNNSIIYRDILAI